MAEDEVITIDVSNIIDAGYCQVCGEELPDKRYKYCDEHNPAKQNRPAATTRRTTPRGNSRTKRSSGGTVSESKAAGSFAKLLIVITAMIAWARIRRMGIPDANGQLSEELSMTDAEAAPIARTIARLSLSNSTTARIVAPIVENDDLIDTAFALWEWNKRTDAALAQYRKGTPAPPRRLRNEPTGQDAQGPAESGADGPGLMDSGWSAERDFRSVV